MITTRSGSTWEKLTKEERRETLKLTEEIRPAAVTRRLGVNADTLQPAWQSDGYRYPEDGRLELRNNRAERSLKLFVMGQKNWLFATQRRDLQPG